MLRQSNEASLFDPTRSGKSCCISKVVKKMSFVEYQAREANGKGTGGKKKEKSDSKRAAQWFHSGHLAVFQLVDRVEEEDDPCFVSFHLGNGSNIGLALAVGEVLQKRV